MQKKGKTDYEKRAKKVGITLTLLSHGALSVLLFSAGFKTIYPPPAEEGIIIDFQNIPDKPIEVKSGHEPRMENPTPKKEIKLVQRSQSAIEGTKANKGSETTIGDNGDVPQYEAPRPKPIDKRALFPSSNNADSIAPQTAKKVSDALKEGHSQGNTNIGRVDGEPSAKLQGRSLMGNLPEPEYTVNKSGRVVVKIRVDQYGSVINAIPGASGTTVQDKTLWEAAKKAALKAKFNTSASSPVVQEGTITYIFRLK